MRDSVAEDTARTARGRPGLLPRRFRASETPLSSRTDGRTHSLRARATGAGPPACLVGSADWDGARDVTGAKLFLKRTREDAAGAPAVDSVSVPVEPLQNQ